MKLTIAGRLKPFCHLPGTACMVPWSGWKVQLFPTVVKFEHMTEGKRGEFQLGWKGPILDFTTELDLEKGVVSVFGHTAEGYRRLSIFMAGEKLTLSLEKEKKKVVLATSEAMPRHPLERLSLGSHKALDWELVVRRKDLKEILPVWVHLGQMVPSSHGKLPVLQSFLNLFLVGFEKMMVPRVSDTDHQGIVEGPLTDAPLTLLTEGRRAIRELFFKETPTEWVFLPSLSPQFHEGRFLDVRGELDFEWSKKMLRQVVIRPHTSREVVMSLQKPLKSFRLRKSLKEKGVRWEALQPLPLEVDQTLYLDRFEK